ncbi:hypothetical protein [Ensifer soli]|uniref:hypothetical protein n=1 Tax=Ciceribacter sp. sgz301302 TaxID=3342379 RepID=UPI0035BB873F
MSIPVSPARIRFHDSHATHRLRLTVDAVIALWRCRREARRIARHRRLAFDALKRLPDTVRRDLYPGIDAINQK